MNETLLKLFAKDAQDLQVVAAVVQDSIVPVSEMTFREPEKSFVMVAHRFRWDLVKDCEGAAKEGDCFERISSALDIEGVESVQYAGFDPADLALMLDLLTVTLEGLTMTLIFAGEASLRLKMAQKWGMKVEDFGESWPTRRLPSHQA